ncbi:MAG: hypothetical protein LBG48_02270, partial [Rickettsiales bacterium]|nr:hypothetical protein [Rickettsiales bacterium]
MSLNIDKLRFLISISNEPLKKGSKQSCPGISKNTIYKIFKIVKESGRTSKELLNIPNSELMKMFNFNKFVESRGNILIPNYLELAKIRKNHNVTVKELYHKHVEESKCKDKIPVKRSTFYSRLKNLTSKGDLTMRVPHNPGTKMEVDWAGKKFTVHLIDKQTIQAHLFVAVLPFSSLIFLKAYENEKIISFIDGISSALTSIGGTVKIITIDNLKTGIIKYDPYDPIINKDLSNLGKYYNIYIENTRAGKPKDKATVEKSVSLVYDVIKNLADGEFSSLNEFNESLSKKINSFNKLERYNGNYISRQDQFDLEELPTLGKLPDIPYMFEKVEFRKVANDYHILYETNHYSVPYTFAGEQVQVNISNQFLRIFYDGNKIAEHCRIPDKSYKTSTIAKHMPISHQEYLNTNYEQILVKAASIGQNVEKVIKKKISNNSANEKMNIRSCRGIINLATSGKFSCELLDIACAKALKLCNDEIKRNDILDIINSLPNDNISNINYISNKSIIEGG